MSGSRFEMAEDLGEVQRETQLLDMRMQDIAARLVDAEEQLEQLRALLTPLVEWFDTYGIGEGAHEQKPTTD